ncbi:MAG: Gfo/Idh/MocA family oxidoreductase [Bacteroidetes bacterium]|nr:Gfo/Idh/MocA family oxidoreductase [Bacteroidota bacterium]MCY4232933.1 Gfo/Idh/MocA family oxidoreductase [Bacteroidota bacterium]
MSIPQLRWGVLSCARIAQNHVIPAIQDSQHGTVVAIASREIALANKVAESHQIPVVCHSYDEVINLSTVDAIYIPLPNHLHVQWSIDAVEAGKHVLCEKPFGLSEHDLSPLITLSKKYPDIMIAEAFMYRYHPQWRYTFEAVKSKQIGELQSAHIHFSYDNKDPDNIRNKLDFGGGGLMDIGCYGISVARWLFDAEPMRVCALMERHSEFKTDILSSIILDFPTGSATVVCATQMQRFQHVSLVGTKGRMILGAPFNISPDTEAHIELQMDNTRNRTIEIPPSNQFSLQFDAFAADVIQRELFSTPLSDSQRNMHIIDACFKSAESNAWVWC